MIFSKNKERLTSMFLQHKEEISNKGFIVTHIGPIGDFVEIGIEPYHEVNAEYLYKIFGKDKVKIVQGQQAVSMVNYALGIKGRR